MPKILWYGSPPWICSSYGGIARNIIPKLKDAGHEVAIFAWNALRGAMWEYEGCTVYPGGQTITGHDILAQHINHFDADILIAVCDPWIFENPALWRMGHKAKVVFWHPCQSQPASKALVEAVQLGEIGLNFSKWGTKVMQEAGADNVVYCPLGVDTNIFKPIEGAKERLGRNLKIPDIEDRFVVSMVAANASTYPLMRKSFDIQFLAFRRFLDEVDDKAILYCHTSVVGMPRGIDLRPLMQSLGLRYGEHVFFPSPWAYQVGIPDSELAQIYNGMDVLLNATKGEGFGMPIIEAQACGTPAITTDYSSMTELTAYGFATIPIGYDWASEPMDGWNAIPSTDRIFEALTKVYEYWNNFEKLPGEEKGYALVESLRWETIASEYLQPRLEDV